MPASSPPATAAGVVNKALGLGEARRPEVFTLEQRLLDAARRGDRATIERAVALGAQLSAKDDIGRSALFLAVMDAHNLELARWLHGQGLPVDDPDVTGRTPLSFAADNGELDIVRFLVERGAVVDSRDFNQRTPLLHATGSGHLAVLVFLADHGADVNARDQFGDTPLIVACAKGHVPCVEVLLRRGADPGLRDQEGQTAAERAAPGMERCQRLPR